MTTAELPLPRVATILPSGIGTTGELQIRLRCKGRSLTMERGAVPRRIPEPSNLSHIILTLELEVFPISCKDGENWRTGSSDIDFKISMSCPILIPDVILLHILLSKHNLMQT